MRSFSVWVRFAAAATTMFASQCIVAQIVTVGTSTLESNQAGAFFGSVVSNAGDVNGDDYDDLIVGAPSFSNGQSGEGRAFLYLGGPTGHAATPAWTAESNVINGSFGVSVAGAGDVNADGFDDVIVGAPAVYPGGGMVYVYLGNASGLAASPVWTFTSNQVGGNGAGPNFGQSVASAGYVNNDIYADVIVGAPGFDNGEVDEGRAFVFLGNATGLNAAWAWTAESDQAGAAFGVSVASAGDVNNDGLDDVIVGASGYDNGESNEGRAYVYHGTSSSLSLTPAWIGEPNVANAIYGSSVAGAGDVNNDTYDDIVVGANQYHNPEDAEGVVFAYYGGLSGLTSTPAWTVEGSQVGSAAYGVSVAGAGDLNNDGFSDVIVGAAGNNISGPPERADIYLGSGSGLATAPAWTAGPVQTNAGFGGNVASAGHVNNDSYSDIVVGARLYDNDQGNEGRAFVYLFAADSDIDDVADPNDNCKLVPNSIQCDSDNDGFGNHCDGDLNNNGFTNAADTSLFRAQLGMPSSPPAYNKADLNCNGAVNAQDNTLFHPLLGSPPGPSGLACAGTVPCP